MLIPLTRLCAAPGQRQKMALRTLIALIAFACCRSALAAIGAIDAFEGDVHVISAAADKAAAKGLELAEGDTVTTGAGAWALLTMTDGASLTLRPNSKVRLDKYRYDAAGKPSENSALIALLQGSFRSITGYIGKTHREGYGISTATATIGIRGTDHEPAYFPPPEAGQKGDQEPGTYDKVNRGETYIRNPHGEVAVSRGQSAFVHQEGSQAPRLLQQVPRFYREHAKFDRAAAERRREFHQTHEAQQRRLQQEQRKERQQQKSHNPRQPGKIRAPAGQRK